MSGMRRNIQPGALSHWSEMGSVNGTRSGRSMRPDWLGQSSEIGVSHWDEILHTSPAEISTGARPRPAIVACGVTVLSSNAKADTACGCFPNWAGNSTHAVQFA
jgi:hypothetical protein